MKPIRPCNGKSSCRGANKTRSFLRRTKENTSKRTSGQFITKSKSIDAFFTKQQAGRPNLGQNRIELRASSFQHRRSMRQHYDRPADSMICSSLVARSSKLDARISRHRASSFELRAIIGHSLVWAPQILVQARSCVLEATFFVPTMNAACCFCCQMYQCQSI